MAGENQPTGAGGEPPAPAPTRGASREAYPDGQLVVEVAGKQNFSVLFGMNKEVLRGRYSRANIRGIVMDDLMEKMPELPGEQIIINGRAGWAKIHDPLSDPENAEVAAKASKIIAGYFGTNQGPAKDREYRNLSAHKIKSWYYWTGRIVQAGSAVVVRGKLPTHAEIDAMPGKLEQRLFYEGQARAFNPRYRDRCDEPSLPPELIPT
jgi:hypothetical protein